MKIPEARKGIANAVQNGTGLRCEVSPPASPEIPCWILLGHIGEIVTMDPDFEVEFDLILLVSLTEENWTDTVDAVLTGDNNVFQALNGTPYNATRWDDYGLFEWNGAKYGSVRVPVTASIS